MAELAGVWRRAAWGALSGGLYVGLAAVVISLFGPWAGWANLVANGLIFAALGAFLFAVGRAIAGKIAGSCLGGALGLILGGVYAVYLFGQQPGPLDGQHLKIAGPTLTGTTIDLEDFRGRVILIDVWATWCPPCREEMPNLVGLYEAHHNEGFDVIGVSLDASRDKLVSFVQEHKIPWPQIFFVSKGGENNPIAQYLQVNAIPATFLVDRNGILVASGLRGKDLNQAVARLLKQSDQPAGRNSPGGRVGFILLPLLGVVLGGVAGAFLQRTPPRKEAS